jgi:nitrate reductase (NAD(P)H)
MAEVEKHDTDDDCWIVVKGKVYDVNKYLEEGSHPGGNASITMNAGSDSTEDFEAVHSGKAWKQLEEFVIGYLDPRDDPNAAVSNESKVEVTFTAAPNKFKAPRATGPVDLLKHALDHPEMYGNASVGEKAEAAAFDRMWAGAKNVVPKDAPVTLNPKKWIPLEVDAKVPLSHDTILLRLKLDSEKHQCGLPVGYHVYLRGEKNGEEGAKKVMRAYTPSSLNGTLGFVEFVIKVYFPNDHKEYPEGGQLTRYLNEVNVGDFVDAKGPAGEIKYEGRGDLIVHGAKKKVGRMTLLAGGTGVAPMLQLIVAVLSDPSDETEITFLFANKTEKDILLKYTLDRLQREHPTRFAVHYTVSKHDETWSGLSGRVNEKMIAQTCFGAGCSENKRTVALLCGPPLFETETCVPALKALGYAAEDIIRY